MKRIPILLLLLFVLGGTARADVPVTLKGSPESMTRQNEVAKKTGLTFVETPSQMQTLAQEGELVPLEGNANYALRNGISSNVARVEMRLFIERLAQQYHEATGEKLVVTSLTRPQSRQPGNSHDLSVHPTGIAVDLRVSQQRYSRAWLESVLLKLERRGLLDITRERWPPHYHVALFPRAYTSYVEGMIGAEALAAELQPVRPVEAPEEEAAPVQNVAHVPSVITSSPDTDASEPNAWSVLALLPVGLIVVGIAYRKRWCELYARWRSGDQDAHDSA